MRVVSLIPSATEIVCALGARESLVGVSHECDYPSDVRDLPVVTRAKIRVDGSSATIDRDVRALVSQGLSVYEIDVARLQALAPDVIVTQQQCEVCAVSYREVETAARDALGSGVAIVPLSPTVLSDIWTDVEQVGAALGRVRKAAEVVERARTRLAAVTEGTADLPRPVVACIEWLEPLMLAGNWMPELVGLAGGSYPFATAGAPSATCGWQTLVYARPEVAVLMPCGFTIAQTKRELARVVERPEWRALPAVRAGRATIADGNAYFNRPGPRIVESAEILAALIHPERPAGRKPAGASPAAHGIPTGAVEWIGA
jgi:iron complex transport system substrate-binding protein